MSASTFAEYDRHLAEFERGRAVWLATASAARDAVERELARKIAKRIEEYTNDVRAFLDHAKAQRASLRAIDVRRAEKEAPAAPTPKILGILPGGGS